MTKNKLLVLGVTVLSLLGSICTTYAADTITVTYNSKAIQFTESMGAPYVESSRVLVPLRAVSEGMSKKVNWNATTKKVTVSDNKTVITLAIGNKIVSVNGVDKITDVPATVKDGRTYVPLRFVSECLNTSVNWDATTKHVSITDITTSDSVVNQPATSMLIGKTFSTSELSQLNYLLYTPNNATADMPLIVYLHGGSGKGNDLNLLTTTNSLPKYVKDNTLGNIPAYIIMPQLPSNKKGWTDIGLSIKELIEYISETYEIDSSRISLTGHSMGGTGAWELAVAYPEIFSCIAPMSGSIIISHTTINALSNMPIWAFVGSKDTIVSPKSSIQFIQKLSMYNANAKITVFDNGTHFDIPELAYLEHDIVTWLIGQTKE